MFMHSKKGESLVEVMVALGIITFIFVGAINIIASSITLNLSARQRTEAVAMVQKNMNEYLAGNTGSGICSVVGRTPMSGESACSPEGSLKTTEETCYWLEVAVLDTATEINDTLGLNNDNFIKIVSHGKWYTRIFGEQEFALSRVVRNN